MSATWLARRPDGYDAGGSGYRCGNVRITGFGLRIAIDLMGSHTGTGPVGRIDEATPMFLRKDVRIILTDDDGRSVLPAGSKGSR